MALAIAEVVRPVASRKTEDGVRMGLELERIRREQDLTQQQVADGLGMTLEGYRNYAKGYGRVTRNTVPRWANALGLTVADLARRLGIPLLTDTDASGLREQLAALMPDASAGQMDATLRELSTLPPHLRDRWIDMARISMLGLREDARENQP